MRTLRRHPREWSRVVWFVIGSLLLAGVFVMLGLRSPTPSSSEDRVVTVSDYTSNLDINYPVLDLENIDRLLKAFVDKKSEAFVKKQESQPQDLRSKLTITHAIPHYGERTVSVVFTAIEEAADGKSATTQYRKVFEIASGKELAVGDLFRDDRDTRQALAGIFYDYFSTNSGPKLTTAQQINLFNFTFSDVKDFLVYEDSVLLYFNPNDLAKKNKAQSVLLHKGVIADLLKDHYVGLDTGRKLDIPPEKVAYTIDKLPERRAPNAGSGKRIALTFDDGPSPHTPRLLDTLARYRSHATFYILGHLATSYPGELRRMVQEGHEIGNHTWLHPNLTTLGSAQLDHQLGDTQNVIRDVTGGYVPRTMRPPYGATNDTVAAYAAKYGLHVVMWSVDPSDWRIKDSQVIYDHIMGSAADGNVILLHDIYGSSVDAAIRVIPELLKQGYQLVTVFELYEY